MYIDGAKKIAIESVKFPAGAYGRIYVIVDGKYIYGKMQEYDGSNYENIEVDIGAHTTARFELECGRSPYVCVANNIYWQ